MFLSRSSRLHSVNKGRKFFRERLTKEHLKVKIYAEKTKVMVTTTFNSQVSVFVQTLENKTVAKLVRTMKYVDNLENGAVIKKQKINNVTPNAKQAVTSGTPTDNNVLGM